GIPGDSLPFRRRPELQSAQQPGNQQQYLLGSRPRVAAFALVPAGRGISQRRRVGDARKWPVSYFPGGDGLSGIWIFGTAEMEPEYRGLLCAGTLGREYPGRLWPAYRILQHEPRNTAAYELCDFNCRHQISKQLFL